MRRLTQRLAVLSHVLPPTASGQAIMLFRRFRGIDPRDYVLLTRESPPVDRPTESGSGLPAKRHALAAPRQFPGPWRRLSSLLAPFYVLRRAMEIARAVRREGCAAVLACSGDLHDLPAAFLASRVTGADFHAYLFDDYVYQWPPGFERVFARTVAGAVLRGAKSVIVPNEFLEKDIARRYGVRPVIVRNTPDEAVRPVARATNARDAAGGRRRILYTGTVYHAHYDAFRNLLTSLRDAPDLRLHLDIYTSESPERLRAQGIAGPVTVYPAIGADDARALQTDADLLFLPLAFETTIPELIRTSSPGKMGEYLASGRPVLVHAPSDSFVAWYFREHDCGIVVEALSPAAMTDGLRRSMDASVTTRVVANARRRAEVDFSAAAADAALLMALEGPA